METSTEIGSSDQDCQRPEMLAVAGFFFRRSRLIREDEAEGVVLM